MYLLAASVLSFSCKSDDNSNTTPTDATNKLVFNGTEYPIAKAVSYTEAASSQDYNFDITFLTANTEIGSTEDYRGNGTIFHYSFVNATNTFLSDGEYTFSATAEDLFDIDYCELYIDYDFAPSLGNPSYDFSSQDGYYDVTQNITVLVSRSGETYTISGNGTTNDGKTFSLQFTGTLEVDPDSQ